SAPPSVHPGGIMPEEADQAKAKTGRPSSFNEAVANEICERIADGESLRKICEDEGFPERRTIFRWLANPEHVEFRRQYALAREASADADDDDIRDIASRVEDGKLDPQAARVAIDAK